jgi:hypothetical protein
MKLLLVLSSFVFVGCSGFNASSGNGPGPLCDGKASQAVSCKGKVHKVNECPQDIAGDYVQYDEEGNEISTTDIYFSQRADGAYVFAIGKSMGAHEFVINGKNNVYTVETDEGKVQVKYIGMCSKSKVYVFAEAKGQRFEMETFMNADSSRFGGPYLVNKVTIDGSLEEEIWHKK